MIRTITLTPADLRECVTAFSSGQLIEDSSEYEVQVEFFQHADGTGAVVVFADKGAPRPPSAAPLPGRPLTNTSQDADELP